MRDGRRARREREGTEEGGEGERKRKERHGTRRERKELEEKVVRERRKVE